MAKVYVHGVASGLTNR